MREGKGYRLLIKLGVETLGAKEYLNKIRFVDQEINAKEEIKHKMRGRLTSISSSKLKDVNVQGGETVTLEDRIIKYVDYSKEIDDLIDELTETKMEVIRNIEKLDDSLFRTLLTERYVNCKEWEEVAECIGYEKRYTLKLHNDALREFAKLDI